MKYDVTVERTPISCVNELRAIAEDIEGNVAPYLADGFALRLREMAAGLEAREGGKSFILWESAKKWCEANPGQLMSVVGPSGSFSVTFTQKPAHLRGSAE